MPGRMDRSLNSPGAVMECRAMGRRRMDFPAYTKAWMHDGIGAAQTGGAGRGWRKRESGGRRPGESAGGRRGEFHGKSNEAGHDHGRQVGIGGDRPAG